MKEREPFIDPCDGQTEKTIGAYLHTLKEGDTVIIRRTFGGYLHFQKATVWSFAGRGDSMIRTNFEAVGGNNVWYKKSGRNNKAPHGQTQLVELTPTVQAYMVQWGEHTDPNSSYRYIHIPKE